MEGNDSTGRWEQVSQAYITQHFIDAQGPNTSGRLEERSCKVQPGARHGGRYAVFCSSAAHFTTLYMQLQRCRHYPSACLWHKCFRGAGKEKADRHLKRVCQLLGHRVCATAALHQVLSSAELAGEALPNATTGCASMRSGCHGQAGASEWLLLSQFLSEWLLLSQFLLRESNVLGPLIPQSRHWHKLHGAAQQHVAAADGVGAAKGTSLQKRHAGRWMCWAVG